MLRRLVIFATLAVTLGAFTAPARAAPPVTLMPGVTYSKTVEFTPHGVVVLHVIVAPRPGDQNGLYQLAPVLAQATVLGGAETVTQLEQDVSSGATVAGIEGDFSAAPDGPPAGIFMTAGALQHTPLQTRSSIGVDTAGVLHVDRVKFFGTWKGTGQRRPLSGVNQTPAGGQVVLFTPAYGAAAPRVADAAEVVLRPFPAAVPGTDLTSTVTAAATTGGGDPIPSDGAVLMATGSNAAKLQAEAPVGTPLVTRLILQPAWAGVTAALGGGPVLVRNAKPVFRTNEDFTGEQVAARSPRAGVGQLADGRIILVAVDGDQPGYSVGLTGFELAETMQRLGAVTASEVESGDPVTVAFDGQLLNRPSSPGGERAVKEALLVQYFGVYAPPPPLPLIDGDPTRASEPLSYKLVRPSTVTAKLVGPDRVSHVLEAAVQHPPGVYPFAFSAYDAEGTWHWNVQATDDLGRVSTADRTFRYDTTLRGLDVPRTARDRVAVRFTLSRPARVTLRIETTSGVVARALTPVDLPAGRRSLVWDGTLSTGTRAYSGTYVAHVFATSSTGTSDLAVRLGFARTSSKVPR
ncbi:MAG: phosphodiester glycosidase family protein [Gaiellaceae bacterium]